MSEPLRLSKTGCSAMFDGMTWPTAGERCGDREWTLRHAAPNPSDLMVAASVMAAYRELVTCPRSKREAVIRQLRRAIEMEAETLSAKP